MNNDFRDSLIYLALAVALWLPSFRGRWRWKYGWLVVVGIGWVLYEMAYYLLTT